MGNIRKAGLLGVVGLLLLSGCAPEPTVVAPTGTQTPSLAPSSTPSPGPTMTLPVEEPTAEPNVPLEMSITFNPDELVISSNKTVDSEEPFETTISYYTAPSKVVEVVEDVTGMEPVESYSGEEWCYEDRTTLTWGDSFYIVFRGTDSTVADEFYAGQQEQKTKQLNPFSFSTPSGIKVGDDFTEAKSKIADPVYDYSENEKGKYEWMLDGFSVRYPNPEAKYDSYGVLVTGLNGVVTHVTAPMWISDHC